MRLAALTLALLLPATTVTAAARPAASGECATCHPQAGVLWTGSVHAGEGVTCTDCHRGDQRVLDAAAGHLEMRRFEDSREILAVCGGCHADVSWMRPYNLAVDQLALYEESAHGQARLAGDDSAPLCTDCHGSHRVLPASDPDSPSFGGNLDRTCGSCHADLGLSQQHGLDARVIDTFASGPHGLLLARKGPDAAPTCATCHDAHGAARPRDADEICGSCHQAARTSFRSGAHEAAIDGGELTGCSSCHRLHAAPDGRTVGEICVDCHDAESSQAQLGGDLASLLQGAREEIAMAELAIFEARRVPLAVRDYEALVVEARRYLQETRSRLHTFRRQPTEDLTRSASSLARRVQSEIEHRLDRRSERIGLALFWFYAAVTMAVLAFYRWRLLAGASP